MATAQVQALEAWATAVLEVRAEAVVAEHELFLWALSKLAISGPDSCRLRTEESWLAFC
jgi:putative NIF3 family GTP cyclohydrolase 1 type 2